MNKILYITFKEHCVIRSIHLLYLIPPLQNDHGLSLTAGMVLLFKTK